MVGSAQDPPEQPAAKHDIFVSYAHVDNDPFPGAEKGWVSNFVNGLKIHLNKKLGRRENYSLWMDNELRGNQAVTPAINGELDGSATLLLFLSTGYLASAWCQQELAAFVKQAGSEAGRIFIVELESVTYPAVLADLMRYPFWFRDDAEQIRLLGVPQPKPDEQEYYTRLDDLGRDLARKIGARQEQAEPKPPIATVYLAQVSDDLAERRAEMARYLDQAQMRVLPERNYSISSFADEMAADLSQCKIFVQLLSDRLGNRLPAFQHRAAVDAGLPVLHWRDRETKPANVDDEDHRALLEAETVISGNLVDFQAVVHHALTKKRENQKEARVVVVPLVSVDAGRDDQGEHTDIFMSYASEDRPHAQILAQALENQNLSVWWDRTIPPGKYYEEVIEEALNAARCVIVLWSESALASRWVRAETGEGFSRKILIPVLIKDVKPPLVFRQIHAAKLIDWNGDTDQFEFQQLVVALSGLLTRSSA